jgi:hypothetical protein
MVYRTNAAPERPPRVERVALAGVAVPVALVAIAVVCLTASSVAFAEGRARGETGFSVSVFLAIGMFVLAAVVPGAETIVVDRERAELRVVQRRRGSERTTATVAMADVSAAIVRANGDADDCQLVLLRVDADEEPVVLGNTFKSRCDRAARAINAALAERYSDQETLPEALSRALA